ncbi:MAG: S-layer homology domain-containing protein, partial [Oscillospiraceae bacterium]|nr:S-layer homology domain-containing protein [Oscillospiraceae bacterium]
ALTVDTLNRTAVLADASGASSVFRDVPADAYYADAVTWALKKGITNGMTEDTFAPNEPCTRGQIVTFLWRAADSPKATGQNPFTDVKESDYYYEAVLWAAEKGITNGVAEKSFAPGASCTRGQAMMFMWRAADKPAASGQSVFTDVQAGSECGSAVDWAVEKGITNGVAEKSFAPNDSCTRGQIVTFLYREDSAK